MNIKIAQLAKKPFAVKASTKNLKKTYQFQLDMAKLNDITDQEPEKVDRKKLSDEELKALDKREQERAVKSFQAMIDIQDKVENYLVDVLKLDENQIDDLEELEQDDVFGISQYVAMRITGMTDAEIEAANTTKEEVGLPAQESK
ncbi:phage tail tube assembly chaperone [Weissella paramesenteroides]|uniref:phage tail tube assembly chaperone n=1 Tax=Weissella paramesenteroides TaxID=1249 RepID=UPI00123AB9D9|nr:phage tail tube assembly chaperone [Weissella paramesenteroides]KAA8445044.1 hypothetical protein FKV72_07805 [Weissella paramesenteroides]KAA8452619.1 hypothetical protein FKV71_04365 [Weissella paramesenteroides]